jgi:hypothetical protein
VFEVHYRDDGATLAQALSLLTGAFQVGDAPPSDVPLVLEEIA